MHGINNKSVNGITQTSQGQQSVFKILTII